MEYLPTRKVVTALVFIFMIAAAEAQQDPQFSQNMFNTMTINPGYAGSNEAICATLMHRIQWVGFDGAPTVSVFNVHAAIKPFKINSGIALSVMNDNIGFDKNNDLSLSYAYRFNLGDGKMGIGLNVEFMNKSLNPEWRNLDKGIYTSPDSDPAIPNAKETGNALDFGAGVFYKTEKLYIGLSSLHLRQAEVTYKTGTTSLARHYYLTSGYTLSLPNPLIEIVPSVFAKSDGKTTQLDLNTCVLYNKRFWGGFSYRIGDAVVGMLGIELMNGLKIGYSYDFTVSDMQRSSSGSHEFMVGYCFTVKKEKIPQKYKSIRFL